jgi:hypothetical protein
MLNLACYTGKLDFACRDSNNATIGTMTQLTYYNKSCITAESICRSVKLVGYNATHCLNVTSTVRWNKIITRTLASEEYYK